MPFSFLSLCFYAFDLSSPRISILKQLKRPRERAMVTSASMYRNEDSPTSSRPVRAPGSCGWAKVQSQRLSHGKANKKTKVSYWRYWMT